MRDMSNRKILIEKLSMLLREQSTQTVMFHAFLANKLGLNLTDHKVLDVLTRYEGMTAGELAKVTGLTTGAITGVIDRLERERFVRRTSDPGDRRKVLVKVLPGSQERLLPVFAPIAKRTQDFLKKYTEAELATIVDFIENSIRVLEDSKKE